jgi:hypothetical protein
LLSCKQKCVELDGKNFIKLAKDTKLLSKALTTTDIDLIFAKVSSSCFTIKQKGRSCSAALECCGSSDSWPQGARSSGLPAKCNCILTINTYIAKYCAAAVCWYSCWSNDVAAQSRVLHIAAVAGEGQGRTQDHMARVRQGTGTHCSQEGTTAVLP